MSKIMFETPLIVKTSKDTGCGGACGCQPSYQLESSHSPAASLTTKRHSAVADEMARGSKTGADQQSLTNSCGCGCGCGS